MGKLLDKYSAQTTTQTSSGGDYEKLKAQGFSDEFIKSRGIPLPKTGIAKILEDMGKRGEARGNLSNWSAAGIIPAAVKGAINIPSNLAKFGGIAGEYLTSKVPGLADFSPSIRKAGDKASSALEPTAVNEGIDNFQKWNGINPEGVMAKVGEEVPAFAAGYGAEKLLMSGIVKGTPLVSNSTRLLAEKFPGLAKYLPGAKTAKFTTGVARNTAQGAGMDVAGQGELGWGTALGAGLGTVGGVYGATVDAVAPSLSKTGAIKNLLGKVGLKNLADKMSKNYGLAVNEVEESINKISDFINNNIKPGKAADQIQQLTELGGKNKKALTEIIDTVSSSNPPEPTIPEIMDLFQRLKSATSKSPTLFSKEGKVLDDIALRADNMTIADIQKLKETADDVYTRLYKPNGEVNASLEEIGALRQFARKEILRQADMASPGLGGKVDQLNKDIAMSNGIAESARVELKNRIIGDRLKAIGVSAGLAGMGAYPMSKITGVPLDGPTGLVVNSIAALMVMRLGNSVQNNNEYTSKMAKRLYDRLGKKSATVLEDYLKNGGQAGLAKRIIKKIDGWLLEMPKPGKNYTKFEQGISEGTTMKGKPSDQSIIEASNVKKYNPNEMFK